MSAHSALAQRAHYYSTSCIHEQHDDCARSCSICASPCQCACHGDDRGGQERALASVGANDKEETTT
jgi:hypothetical protein